MSDLGTPPVEAGEERTVDETLAQELVERARTEGVELVGPGGLLTDLTKTVLETALEAEMEDHLGYAKHAVEGRDRGNSRNGTRSKTVLTEVGEVAIEVPRDREGSFEPKIVRKRQRRLAGVDELVISLTAKGLTTGEISAHLADVYGAEVSKDTISRITDAVLEELAGWQSRPLERLYPVVFIDAIHVKIRDGKVANRPVYTVVGVTLEGERDILGLWVGDGSEGAKYWHQVLSEILNRGTVDVCIIVCDGLRGLPEAIGDVVRLDVLAQTCDALFSSADLVECILQPRKLRKGVHRRNVAHQLEEQRPMDLLPRRKAFDEPADRVSLIDVLVQPIDSIEKPLVRNRCAKVVEEVSLPPEND